MHPYPRAPRVGVHKSQRNWCADSPYRSNTVDRGYFQRGDLEIYRVDPPLGGYRIIAAATSPWAMGAQYIDADGNVHGRNDDPVSTTLYGVASEALQVGEGTRLTTADGSCPARALAEWGYTVWGSP